MSRRLGAERRDAPESLTTVTSNAARNHVAGYYDLIHRLIGTCHTPHVPHRVRSRAALADIIGSKEVLGRPNASGEPSSWVVTLTDGEQVLVRMARPDDTVPLQTMNSRCSPASRYLRYFGSASQAPAALLPVLLGLSPDSVALVGEAGDRRLVALANLFTNDDATGDVALLVEDSWQRRGLGTALMRRLIAVALDRGLDALTAVTLASNDAITRVLEKAGSCVEVSVVGDGLLELRAFLPHRMGYATSLNESKGAFSLDGKRLAELAGATASRSEASRPCQHRRC